MPANSGTRDESSTNTNIVGTLELIALGVLLVVSNFTRRARYANSVGDTNRFNLALRLGFRICGMDCRVWDGISEWHPGRDQGHKPQGRARARRRIVTSHAEGPNSWESGTSERALYHPTNPLSRMRARSKQAFSAEAIEHDSTKVSIADSRLAVQTTNFEVIVTPG